MPPHLIVYLRFGWLTVLSSRKIVEQELYFSLFVLEDAKNNGNKTRTIKRAQDSSRNIIPFTLRPAYRGKSVLPRNVNTIIKYSIKPLSSYSGIHVLPYKKSPPPLLVWNLHLASSTLQNRASRCAAQVHIKITEKQEACTHLTSKSPCFRRQPCVSAKN